MPRLKSARAGIALVVGILAFHATACRPDGRPARTEPDTTIADTVALEVPRSVRVSESRPGLLARAVFRPGRAVRLATDSFPCCPVESLRIEDLQGRLVYDLQLKTDSTRKRVLIDASTGALLASGLAIRH